MTIKSPGSDMTRHENALSPQFFLCSPITSASSSRMLLVRPHPSDWSRTSDIDLRLVGIRVASPRQLLSMRCVNSWLGGVLSPQFLKVQRTFVVEATDSRPWNYREVSVQNYTDTARAEAALLEIRVGKPLRVSRNCPMRASAIRSIKDER
jgi:hypothetical protein